MSTTLADRPVREIGLRYFDLAELRDLCGYFGPGGADALFDRFAEELPYYADVLERALAVSDLRTLARTVHNLRGTVLSFSCMGLAPLCDSVRTFCERGDVEASRQAAAVLAQANRRALAELQRLREPGGLLAA